MTMGGDWSGDIVVWSCGIEMKLYYFGNISSLCNDAVVTHTHTHTIGYITPGTLSTCTEVH